MNYMNLKTKKNGVLIVVMLKSCCTQAWWFPNFLNFFSWFKKKKKSIMIFFLQKIDSPWDRSKSGLKLGGKVLFFCDLLETL